MDIPLPNPDNPSPISDISNPFDHSAGSNEDDILGRDSYIIIRSWDVPSGCAHH